MFAVPDGYRAVFGDRDGAAGQRWLAGLPGLAARHADAWSLRPDGPARHGFVGVVWPVRRPDGTPAMLKITWPHDEAEDEPVALAAWAGRGAVRLLARADADGVLLLERLDADRSLTDEPIDAAVEIAARLLRRLAVPAPALRRDLAAVAARQVEGLPAANARWGGPVPARLLAAAVAAARALGPSAGSALVDEDPHYANVLRGAREPWLVIDPKPIAGDPEYGVIPMLWNREDEGDVASRFRAIVAAAELDPERARGWTLVRAVANWLWALAEGHPWLATACAAIAAAMTGA